MATQPFDPILRNARKPGSLADLEALPASMKGEIIDGVLYAAPRPRGTHAMFIGGLESELWGPFVRGLGAAGRWLIAPEPGIEVPGSPEFSPDLAGWKTERLPRMPADEPIRVVPDWVCEILSPSNRRFDLLIKRPFYARLGVRWCWTVDLDSQTITASRNESGRWLELQILGREAPRVKLEPFESSELDLSGIWDTVFPLDAPK